MLNNERKIKPSKKKKTELNIDFILEQILNLDIQKKTNEGQSMKSDYKSIEKTNLAHNSWTLIFIELSLIILR